MRLNKTLASVALALLVVTSLLPPGIVGTANAQDASDQYTIIQGSECWEVTPFEPGDQNPEYPEETIRPHVEMVDWTAEFGDVQNESWDGSPTIESVMDYRYRDPAGGVHDNPAPWGQTSYYAPWLHDDYLEEPYSYATYGLWNWSTNQESHMFFYDGPEGDSVVMRHDKLFDNTGIGSHGPYNGYHPHAERDGYMTPDPDGQPGGGTASFVFHDLPQGEWAYLDDLYPENMNSIYYADDNFDYDPTQNTRYGHRNNNYGAQPIETYDGETDFTAHWTWGENRTDGGAYRGLENLAPGESVTIEPHFNEEAYFWNPNAHGEEDRLTDWVVRRKGQENVELDMTQEIEIRRGSHCSNADFEFRNVGDGDTPTAEVNTTVGFDAGSSGGTDVTYDWDVDGDGEYEETNRTDPYLSYTYDGSVTGEVSVTLRINDGETRDTETKALRVEQRESPDPNVNVSGENQNSLPEYHVVGETLTFDATDTTDNVALNESSAVWRVDGDVTATGQLQYAHAFESTGDHDVTFEISDQAGLDASETVPVDVDELDTDAPSPSGDVIPDEAEAGASLTFDASDSDDERGIVEYRWYFDGDDESEVATSNATVDAAPYDAPGDYEATLEVEDANGNVDNTTVSVTMQEPQPPTVTDVSVPERVATGQSFPLEGSATDDGEIAEYRWLVDGTVVATGDNATHAFEDDVSEPRNHTVQLEVVDAAGELNRSAERTITVLPPDESPPNAALSVDANETNVGDAVEFDASESTDPPHHDVVRFHWDFDGNGTDRVTTDAVVDYEYDDTGTYNATVAVEDRSGNNGTAGPVRIEVDEREQAHSGGSSGGGSVSLGPPPVLTETERVGPNEAAIDVRNGRSDETVRADLPASDVADTTGVTFRNLALDVAGDEPHVVFRTAASADAPDDVPELTATDATGATAPDETLAYLDLGADYIDSEVENATVEFAVQRSALGDLADASDVTAYGYDGSWTELDATVVESSDDAYRLETTADGLDTLAVGADANLAVTDAGLAADTVASGEEIEATATVENAGSSARTATVNLTLSESVVASETVEVAPGDTEQVTLSGTAPTPGSYEVTVGGTDAGTLSVEEVQPADVSVADVSLNSSTIAAGESVEITAAVENAGGQPGERTVALTMFGEQLTNQTVEVAPGETEEVTFVREVDAAGSYSVEVGGETATLEVESSGDDDGIAPPTPDVPGFGVGAAVAALLAAVLVARLRR